MLCLCFLFLAFSEKTKAQGAARADQVKAAFLFHFTQFVKWPPEAFTNTSEPFVIGILGTDPYGAYLDRLLTDEKVSGRPIVVKRFADEEKAGICHLLFINKSIAADALAELHRNATLTVGDAPDFTGRGGIIRFYTEQNKVRFEINITAAKAAGIEISSKLLRLAKLVEN